MKKIYLFSILFLSIFSYSQNFGEFASGIRINNIIYNTSGVAPNKINSDPGALNFEGASLGTFGQNSSCAKVTAGEIKTFKNASANVCSATLNWRVYPESASPSGSFNTIALNTVTDCNIGTNVFNDGLGPCTSGDQKWKDYTISFDFINSLISGNYILEVYYSYTGSEISTSTCETTKYISNLGQNYKASFTVSNPITSPTISSSSVCEGDSITLTANPFGGTAPYTFNWSGPNGYTSASENPVINNVVTSNSGIYSVITTDACGAISTSQSTTAVVVNTKIDPEFDATLPAICKDGIAPLLSTTSTNGITGTWNPSIVSNQNTASYLFTPNSGQCANTFSFTIFVVKNVTPVFTLPPSICSGDTPPVLPNISNNGIVGTWSPATVSNTTTGTYTFTPTPNIGQCALPKTVQIIVNALVATFLPAIPPICSGDTLAPLPTTSTNGVTGTWSPAINNTATTTYTFTPTSGQCATSVTSMTIVVNPIIALFSQVAPICSGDALAPLPTTSTNGVTGNWSPAMNNTVTTIYTFTPTAGQCAVTPATMTIVVNATAAVFSQVAPICSGNALAPLPTTSTNGVTGTWSPAMNNTATTTYTFTPTAGQCTVNPVTMTIVVNPILAVFSQVAPICSGDVLTPLPITSTNGVTGTWSPVINNTATTTYTFTPTAGQCTVTPATMTIVVNPILAVFIQVAPICSGAVLAPLHTTSTNGVTGTWSPVINNTATTTYTFTPTAGQCTVNPVTMTIVVNPILAVFIQVAPICSGDTLAPLPTTSNNGVSGTWSPAINNTATTTYTFTPTAGQCTVNPVTMTIVVNPILAVFSQVAPICSGAVLAPLPTTSSNGVTGTWSPVINNTATTTYTFTPTAGQCTVNPVTMTIVVNPILAVFSQVAPICSGVALATLPTTSTNGVTGTWSPAINNTATTTYTFTPTTGQCTVTPVTMTIVVNPILAVFGQVAPICSGDALAPLPTTSTNGVSGTWSPAINNTATTTYTFTPTAGQCTVNPVTMTIVVNPILAVFSQVAPICSGAVLAPLPTTSSNGVTGTWSPAINNTATTTYTFTPTAGQCTVNPITMTIVVNPIVAIFSQVAPICSGNALTALPTTSTNGVTGTWSPTINNTLTTTYTFTPTVGQCTVNPVTMTIVVNPIVATFSQVAPICSGDVLAPLPTTSTNGISGTWSPTMNNTVTTTYTFTPTAGQCAVNPVTMTIVVNPIVATFSQVAPICSGAVLAPLPTTSTNGVNGTWSPAVNNTATTTYTFTPTAGQCTVNPVTMTIVVNPILAMFSQVAPICSGDALATLPTTSTNGVTGTWSPTINNTLTTTYTFTPTVGQCTVNPVTMTIVVNPIVATFNQVAPICSGDALATLPTTSTNGVTGTWSPAMNNMSTTTYTFTPTAGQCTVNPATMTIVVNPVITPTFTTIAPICSGSPSPVLPTTSNNLITGTWNPATVSNTTSATYTFTPSAGQCALPTTLDVTITPKTIPIFNPIADVCYGSLPPSLPATSTNGISGTWNPSIVSNTVSGIYTFTPTPGVCATTATLNINVNSITPIFNIVSSICANTTAPILPSPSSNGITGIWNPATVSNTISGTYTFTPNAGQCATTTILNITVNPILTPSFTPISPICFGALSPVLPLTSINGVTGTWNPAVVSNTASGIYNFTPNVGECAIGTTMSVTVNPTITPNFTAIAPICSGSTRPVLPTTSTNSITGTWNPAIVSNTTSGIYTFTPTTGQCGLSTTMNITVNQSPTAFTVKTTDVINESPNGIIEISGPIGGTAPYQYSINNSSLISDATFSNLPPGNYTITIQDFYGCQFSKVAKINSVCMYPNAITPNNDTHNDSFNLKGCDVVNLKIFNRYGREVNSYTNYSDQWDGKNNKGESLPDGTYFYVAEIKGGTSKSGWVFIGR